MAHTFPLPSTPLGSRRPVAAKNVPAGVRGELFEYLLITGLIIWLAAVQFPLIFLTPASYDLSGDLTVNVLRFVPLAIVFLVGVDFAFLGKIRTLFAIYSRQNASGLWWMLAAFASLFTASLIHGLASSVLYSLLLLFVAANLAIVWMLNVRVARFGFRIMFVISLMTATVPLVLYGAPVGRFVGAIHPNIYGTILLGMTFFWVLGFDRFNIVIVALAFGLAMMVSSRYTVLALIIFSVFVFGFDRRISVMNKIFLVISGLFVLLIPKVQAMLSDLFLVGDVSRGLEGGVSGRFDLYSSFLPQIEASPWIGYGFRAREMYESSHNGLLTTLLENGLLGGGILYAWVVVRFYRAIAAAIVMQQRIYAHVAGGLLAVTVGAFFQPQLFNFGDPMGLCFLLFLVAPILPMQPGRRLSAAPQRMTARGGGAAAL